MRSHAVIYRGCRIGGGFFCGHAAVIREGCRIGRHVTIGSQTILDPDCVVEDGATVHSHCYLGEATHVSRRAWVGPGVITLNTKYPKCGHAERQRYPVVIGESAVIGGGAVLMPGVVIGAGAMVAAGAVVSRDVPADTVAVGVPARATRTVRSIECCPGRRYRMNRSR